MKYMGSKNRIAKEILPIILKNRKPDQYYVEPFVGGANTFDKVEGPKIGADLNCFLVALLKEMQRPDFVAPLIDVDLYNEIKENPKPFPPWVVGFAGTQLTYGSKWFDSYRRDSKGKRNYAKEAKNNIDQQGIQIRKTGGYFLCSDYRSLIIPDQSILYCDPPYAGTTRYKGIGDFDSDLFWTWVREKQKKGHRVYVSEYEAPPDFRIIWEKIQVSSLTKNTGSKKATEKLFVYAG